MQELERTDPSGDQESPVVIQSEPGPSRPRKFGELLGAAKRDAAGPASKKRGPCRKRVTPTSRQRAAGGRFTRGTAPGAEAEGEENEPILEVGEAIEPPPPAAPAAPETIKQLCDLLYVGHMMAAAQFGVPEMQLGKDEARELGTATANVARHYQWGAMAEKTKDWLLLAGSLGMIYGPRVKAIKARVVARKAGMEQVVQ